MSLKWFLNDIFSSLDRGFLLESKTRQQLLHYFNTVIEQFRDKNMDSNAKEGCRLIVEMAIEFHEKAKLENGNICLFGKYHNILHVAAKLCHQWELHDTRVVCSLLASIYDCEKTFEKFFECSIFGTKVTQLISGWRSDYRTFEENLTASIYFLKHATEGRLEFIYDDRECNFIDVPMSSYEKLSPLKTAVMAEKWDVVTVLIKYGAITHLSYPSEYLETYSLFHLFVQKLLKYDQLSYYASSLILCFKLFLRTISSLSAAWTLENDDEEDEENRTWPVVLTWLREMGIENASEPRSLKHLARCAARKYLAKNHSLPAQHEDLNIPKTLESYLNLDVD